MHLKKFKKGEKGEESEEEVYQLEEKSGEDLYNEILAETNFEDQPDHQNFDLNRPLMQFIKGQDVYREVARNPRLKLDFFLKIFKSVFFFRRIPGKRDE